MDENDIMPIEQIQNILKTIVGKTPEEIETTLNSLAQQSGRRLEILKMQFNIYNNQEQNKTSILDHLYNTYGDFWISQYLQDIDKWTIWNRFSEQKFNSTNDKLLRSIFSEEIVLDIESDDKVQEIKELLISKNLKFKLWRSGGRGYHFHLFFSGLKSFDETIRPYIKEAIIKELSFGVGDLKKKDNKNLIGCEFYQHRKGNYKELMFETDTNFYEDNKLPETIFEFAKTLPEKYEGNVLENPTPTIIFKKPCDAIENMLKNGAKKGNRNKHSNFITQQLRDYCGYSMEECFESLKIFNENSEEHRNDNEIKRDLQEQYKRKYNINCNTLKECGLCPWKYQDKCPKYKYFNGIENKESLKVNDIIIESPEPSTEEPNNEDKLKIIIHPGIDKLISIFADEVSEIVKDKNTIFYRPDAKDIVEIGKLKIHHSGEEIYTGFLDIKPGRFITFLEKYCTPCIKVWNSFNKTWEFKRKSISGELASTVLNSAILQESLPQITRIFTVPVPIIHNGILTFPKRGYDERFGSWLPYDAPEISDPNMSLEDAKKILDEIFKEFCFETAQDKSNAIAALLTPFLRGIFPTFNTRTPVFFYLANRERAGKDYLAGITGIVYEGQNLEESPISDNNELRKKILSSLIIGRKRLHFSNNKGHLDNDIFEAIVTAEKHSDRVLGKNEILTFDNELDFSLSGNIGITYTPDFANRCRFIRLFLDIEDANAREFKMPNLHAYVRENRNKILSAMFALIKNWIEKGSKGSSIPFTSFYNWSRICGGIMEESGYLNPCNQDKQMICFGGDSETQNMKLLFEECYQQCPEQWITRNDIINIINNSGDIFSFLNLVDNKSDQMQFGHKIVKFQGRVLSGIRLIPRDSSVRASRQSYMFTKKQSFLC